MKIRISATILVALLMMQNAFAWDQEEHRVLADSVYATVMEQCTSEADDTAYYLGSHTNSVRTRKTILGEPWFGNLVAHQAADDFAPYRFHERGETILEQLKRFSAIGYNRSTSVDTVVAPDQNVVTAYLQRHLRALHYARIVADSRNGPSGWLESVLRIEAQAQGFLADAFAAGHILSYNDGFLAPLQKRNRIEAHNYHRDRGVYVINGRGDVWQTFGDGLLHWYAPTYRTVFEACATSLKEVLVVSYVSAGIRLPRELSTWLHTVAPGKTHGEVVASWLANHTGQEHYEEVRLPSLMLLPMPVTASWSHRTSEVDGHGIRQRHHYPQLREIGFHDPDLSGIDLEFLYSKSSVPDWMVPAPLRSASSASAHELIRSNPDWASVRWIQQRFAPPSYKGLLVQLGSQLTIGSDDTRSGGTVALGYGLWDDLLLVKNVSVSVTFMPSFHEPNHRLLVISGGGGIDLPGEGLLKVLRFDGGPAIGLGEDFNDFGTRLVLGFDTRVFPIKFTNAGITFRVMYQWFNLDQSLSGPALELIWQ